MDMGKGRVAMRRERMNRQLFVLSIVMMGLGGVGCENEKVAIYPPVAFRPILGGAEGGIIHDNLIVTVVDAWSGKPLNGAVVFIHQGNPLEEKAKIKTGEDGVASFANLGISGPVTVTVIHEEREAYDTISFCDINAAKVTIPLTIRKPPDKVSTALTFLGLDTGDSSLMLFRNEVPYKEMKIMSQGNQLSVDPDPLVKTVPCRPIGFSAMATDQSGNTSKFGLTVMPDGPLPVSTPAMINMSTVNTGVVKVVSGKMAHPPANLKSPKNGWEPYKRYNFQVFLDGGLAGLISSGFANISNTFEYQAFCVSTPELPLMSLEVSAFNRMDAWAEMTTSILHGTFQALPEKHDFEFKNVPKDLHRQLSGNDNYPILHWEPVEGDLDIVSIYQSEYDYTWNLYLPGGKKSDSLPIPPIPMGSIGSILPDQMYRFRVETWTIPGFDYNNFSFQALANTVTHKARSTLFKFTVHGPDIEQDQLPDD